MNINDHEKKRKICLFDIISKGIQSGGNFLINSLIFLLRIFVYKLIQLLINLHWIDSDYYAMMESMKYGYVIVHVCVEDFEVD